MMTRILVTAASRHGATDQIARAIAHELSASGADVDRRPIDHVDDLSRCDAAVVGSAVYMGSWMGAARDLVESHLEQLRAMPVWLFSSGPLGSPAQPSEQPDPTAKLAGQIGARDHAVFPGRLDREQLRLRERAVVSVVHAPYGDYRNWSEIRAWARGIASELQSS